MINFANSENTKIKWPIRTLVGLREIIEVETKNITIVFQNVYWIQPRWDQLSG